MEVAGPLGPLRGLEGVPGLPGAPQDEAGLTRKFVKITLGQWPASCESPLGLPAAREKHILGQLAAPDQTWDMQVSAGWLHTSCHGAGRCQPWWEHYRGRREDGKKHRGHDWSAWREDMVWPLHAINLFPDLR